MPLQIVRNDITKMNTDAIVNTANRNAVVGDGCDRAIYMAAGYEKLLSYRKENIGSVPEGKAFITPGFALQAKYIIHAVSPLYPGSRWEGERKLRSCYRKSLRLAKEYPIKSIAFPLISTGSFGFPKEEGMRIAIDEITTFLRDNELLIYLVVFDEESTRLGERISTALESYIDRNYVERKIREEYKSGMDYKNVRTRKPERDGFSGRAASYAMRSESIRASVPCETDEMQEEICETARLPETAFDEQHEGKLEERMRHLSDSFSQYLQYLIKSKHMKNAEVYKRAIVDKKTFSKIKNHVDYHPQKLTALCLCVGAKLNLDESRDLLARAGYALSPCDKTDIIFSYFIENQIYDMIELDIQLEEHGLPCIIT